MQERSVRSAAAIAGIVFVILVVVTIVPTISAPMPDKSAATIVKWYADHRTTVLTSGALTGLSMIAFLAFIGYLYHLLSRLGGARGALASIMLATGIATDTIATVAVLPSLALAVAASRSGVPTSGALVHALADLNSFGFALVLIGVALFLAVVGLLMADGALAPRWAQWVAYLGAALSLVGGVATAFVSKSGKPNPASLIGMLGLALFAVVVVAVSVSLLGDRAPAEV
jgi:hypothetical protein